MKYQKVKRDPLRALTSEMLPYEVPIPFNTALLYGFLRRIRFTWINEGRFSVLTARLGKAEKYWLEILFDGIEIGEGQVEAALTVFDLRGSKSSNKYGLRHPYKYRAKRNNGKNRNLAIPHPQSMVSMAYFISEYRDSIAYFTNRSNFSIRYPSQVARLHVKKSSELEYDKGRESYGVEQFDLEYEHVTSFFSYRRYNNINRFYASAEFRACERKYPRLLRADIAKCFDSIYTHTLSWVTNGIRASKEKHAVEETFGAKFDHYMQYLNYAETSGIVIGPEFSRIFAEIILQEVDVRVERELAFEGLVHSQDYEIMRYVDDYFIFLADAKQGAKVEEILSRHLSEFKLHLNDHKQHEFDTPLRSEMSVAKLRIREQLKARTTCDLDLEDERPNANLYFPTHKAILDYKSILIDTDLDHGEIANSYLYELDSRVSKTLNAYRKFIDLVRSESDTKRTTSAHSALVNYLIANLDVAVFVYAGAPSVSHAVKLTRLIMTSLKELETNNVGLLWVQSYRDKVSREVEAQLSAVPDESAFGIHTLLLVDCLIFLNPEVPESILQRVLQRRGITVFDLDAFGVLTFLRRFSDERKPSELKNCLLGRAKELIHLGEYDQRYNAERVILRLSLPSIPSLSLAEVKDVADLSTGKARILIKSKVHPSMFAWNASEDYYERLQLKIAQLVY